MRGPTGRGQATPQRGRCRVPLRPSSPESGPPPTPPAAVPASHTASAPFLPCTCRGGRLCAMGYRDPAGDRPPQLPGAGTAGSHPEVTQWWHGWIRKPRDASLAVSGGWKLSPCTEPQGLLGRTQPEGKGPGQSKYPDGQRSLISLGTEPTLGTVTVPAPKGPTDPSGSQMRSTQPSPPWASLEEFAGPPVPGGGPTPGTREVGASGLPFGDTLAQTAWPAFAWRQRRGESVPWPLPRAGPRTPGEGQQQRGHWDGHSAEAAGRRRQDSGGPGSLRGRCAHMCACAPAHRPPDARPVGSVVRADSQAGLRGV